MILLALLNQMFRRLRASSSPTCLAYTGQNFCWKTQNRFPLNSWFRFGPYWTHTFQSSFLYFAMLPSSAHSPCRRNRDLVHSYRIAEYVADDYWFWQLHMLDYNHMLQVLPSAVIPPWCFWTSTLLASAAPALAGSLLQSYLLITLLLDFALAICIRTLYLHTSNDSVTAALGFAPWLGHRCPNSLSHRPYGQALV